MYIPALLFSSEAGKAVRAEFYRSQRPEEELKWPPSAVQEERV